MKNHQQRFQLLLLFVVMFILALATGLAVMETQPVPDQVTPDPLTITVRKP